MDRTSWPRHISVYGVVAAMTVAVILSNDDYYLLIATYVGINALLALSLQLLFGFTGQISFAQAAFYGVGAYAASILMVQLRFPLLVAAAIGALVAAAVAGLVGIPTLRLKGHYLAIATLAMQVAIYQFFVQASGLTGGTVGMFDIPRPTSWIPGLGRDAEFLVTVVITVLVAYTLAYALVGSRFGRQMMAVREDEIAAQSLAIPTRKVKVLVFALSAFIAAFGGAFYASYIGFISPVTFNLDWSISILAMVVIGGMGRLSGAALGAFIITGINQVLYIAGQFEFMIFGALVVIVLIVLPRGAAGGIADLYAWTRRRLSAYRHDVGTRDAEHQGAKL